MQKERRLEGGGDDVRPVDGPVEQVESGGVFESVEDERDETEDVEVGGFGRGPSAEEDIQADAQVDHCDQAVDLEVGFVDGLEDDADIERWGESDV